MSYNQKKRKNYVCCLFGYLLSLIIIVFVIVNWHRDIISIAQRIRSKLTNNDDSFPSIERYVTVHLSPTLNGPKLRGRIINEQNVQLAEFLGIPYAQKPKRFHKSEPDAIWSGTLDALKWPPLCIQNRVDQYDYLTKVYNKNISEDCLYLNIWSPLDNVIRNNQWVNTNDSKLLPVIIFIHGGAFSYMGISMEAFYGGVISSLGNVVFVTINYRVGLFGFFNNELEDSGYDKNVGLYDQIAAIQWIRKNIEHFGGDPEQITLQGQSAGAISIGLLMISPESRNLFKRAILQSGSPMMLKQIFLSTHFNQVIQLANCSKPIEQFFMIKNDDDKFYSKRSIEDDQIDYNNQDDDDDEEDDEYDYYQYLNIQKRINETNCLERLSVEMLNQIQNKMLENNTITFSPSIPSNLLPYFAEDESESVVQKDILIGANLNESTLYLHQELPEMMPLKDNLNLTYDDLLKIIDKLDKDSAGSKRFQSMVLEQLNKLNIKGDEEIVRHFIIFLSDLIFKGPVFKFAKLLSQEENRNVYLYSFNETSSLYPNWIGSAHSIEMDYVFGIALLHPERFTKSQQELSIRMIKTWTHFAHTGKMLPQNGVEWPRLDDRNLHMNLMTRESSIGNNLFMMFYDIFSLLYDST